MCSDKQKKCECVWYCQNRGETTLGDTRAVVEPDCCTQLLLRVVSWPPLSANC